LFQNLFGMENPPIFFDIMVHLGTLLAVVFYLRKEIIYILKTLKEKQTIKLILLLILGTIPAVFAGLFLEDKIDSIFTSITLIGMCFIITSIILFATKFFKNSKKETKDMTWFDSLFVGLFQAFAILPGVSRSGSTMSASLYRGLKSEDAFKFSFLLSIPVILGAFVLQFIKQDFMLFNDGILSSLLGFLCSIIFGFLSLKIIEKAVIKGKLHYFAFYTLALGLAILIFI